MQVQVLSPAPPPPDRGIELRPREIALLYGALQSGAALLLAAAWLAATLLASLAGSGAKSFLGSWLAAFVLVPITFVPALVRWQRWAIARFGRHPRWYRAIIEFAFAAEVVGFILLQRLA